MLWLGVASSGCAIGSHFVVGATATPPTGGEYEEPRGCGAGLTVAAVAVEGVIAGAILMGDELSTPDKVGLTVISTDVVIGGLMAFRRCVFND